MRRRDILGGLSAAVAFPALPAPAQRVAASPDDDPGPSLRAASRDAYIYTLPLIESAKARAAVIAGGSAPGTLFKLRKPTTPATQRVTTPNNDTLNARGWIDLAQGSARITLPATGDRYVSVAMMDMYSNNFAVLGSRATGPYGGTFTIVGPDAAAPPGAIRSPTRWMWVLVCLLTAGGNDLLTAHRVQDGFRLEAPAWRSSLPVYAERDADWRDYFAAAARLLVENPPPVTDTAILRRIAPLGLGRFDAARFNTNAARDIAAGVADAKRALSAAGEAGQVVNGWAYPRATLGDFAQDYAYRAQVALNGFAALPPVEAMYLFATGPHGDMRLDSKACWRLRLTRDTLPPVDAFWSLTTYRATDDGQFFLFDNPIARYSIGDRTSGLVRGRDGALDILMQIKAPAGVLAANWLPAPADAPFGLVFRAYRPRQPILDGRWRLPPLERLT